jgi:hypothetical protein
MGKASQEIYMLKENVSAIQFDSVLIIIVDFFSFCLFWRQGLVV